MDESLRHTNKSSRSGSGKSGSIKVSLDVAYPTGMIFRIRVIGIIWECGLLCEALNKKGESSGPLCFAPVSSAGLEMHHIPHD